MNENEYEKIAGIQMPTLKLSAQMALEAYNDGYRIIARWFNDAFDALKIPVHVECEPPPKGITLDNCRVRLSNALQGIRMIDVELGPDDQLDVWVVGYLCGKGNENGAKPAGIGMREPVLPSPWGSAEAVLNRVRVKYSSGWSNAVQWQEFVIEPMEQQAQLWRKWLERFSRSWTAPMRLAAIKKKFVLPDINLTRLTKAKPDLIRKAGSKWIINESHPEVFRK